MEKKYEYLVEFFVSKPVVIVKVPCIHLEQHAAVCSFQVFHVTSSRCRILILSEEETKFTFISIRKIICSEVAVLGEKR
jgi:hypothetical protein